MSFWRLVCVWAVGVVGRVREGVVGSRCRLVVGLAGDGGSAMPAVDFPELAVRLGAGA